MRIMYVITRSEWGGAQQYVFDLILEATKKHDQVLLVTGENGELTDRLKAYAEIVVLKDLQREINFIKDIKCTYKLYRIIKQFQPDIVHLNSSKAGAVGRSAMLFYRKAKVIFTAHGWAFSSNSGKLKKVIFAIIEKLLLPFTNKIICVSKYDFDLGVKFHLYKPTTRKIVVIHNGAKDIHITKEKIKKEPYMVMVARFDQQKNQRLLIKAYSKIENPKIKLFFVGDGPTLESCKKLTSELNCTDSVKFLGFKKNIQKILNDAQLFVLITNYEGLPISIIEALRTGLPVIASNVGGIPELVKNHRNGYLVSDVLSIQNALIKLQDPARRAMFGIKSRKIYEKSYSLTRELEETRKLYA